MPAPSDNSLIPILDTVKEVRKRRVHELHSSLVKRMSGKLIPIFDTVKEVRKRRVWEVPTCERWFEHKFNHGKFRGPVILPWLETRTTGKFILEPRSITFELEQDYVMFKIGYNDDW